MYLKDLVCDFEYAKKLKELDVKQESIFWYNADKIKSYKSTHVLKNDLVWESVEYYKEGITLCTKVMYNENFINYSAFTSDELLEMLPVIIDTKIFEYQLHLDKIYNYYICYLHEPIGGIDGILNDFESDDKKLSNALAKMLIYLIENSYINIGDILKEDKNEIILENN